MTTATLNTTLAVLKAFREFTGNPDMPAQQVAIVCYVALNPEQTQGQIAEGTGVSQSSVSRNCARLGRGIAWDARGADLVTVEEYLYDRRLRAVKLTQRGEELIKTIHKDVVPKARHWFKQAADKAMAKNGGAE